jgi:hypothetical protein
MYALVSPQMPPPFGNHHDHFIVPVRQLVMICVLAPAEGHR